MNVLGLLLCVIELYVNCLFMNMNLIVYFNLNYLIMVG